MNGQPEADVNLAAQMWRMQERMDEWEERDKKREQENEELRASHAELKRKVEAQETAKAMYNNLGGEDTFYLDIDTLLPEMLEELKGNEEKTQKVKKWAEEARKTKIKRIAICVVSGATFGTISGSVTLGVHLAQACTACAVAAGPAVGIVVGGAAIGAVVVGVFIGFYKLYRWYKMSKGKEGREAARQALASAAQKAKEIEKSDVTADVGYYEN